MYLQLMQLKRQRSDSWAWEGIEPDYKQPIWILRCLKSTTVDHVMKNENKVQKEKANMLHVTTHPRGPMATGVVLPFTKKNLEISDEM